MPQSKGQEWRQWKKVPEEGTEIEPDGEGTGKAGGSHSKERPEGGVEERGEGRHREERHMQTQVGRNKDTQTTDSCRGQQVTR